MAPALPWRPAETGSPLLWWDAAVLDDTAALLQGALCAWQDAWGWQEPLARVACAPANAGFLDAGDWLPCWRGTQATAWIALRDRSDAHVLSGLFAAPVADGERWAGVSQACLHDLTTRVAGACGAQWRDGPSVRPPLLLGRPWSGAVAAWLCKPRGWKLLLSPAAVQAHAARRPTPPDGTATHVPLVNACDALAGRQIRLEARLAGCELDLGTLQQLQPGDVVPLRHALQRPACLADAAGQVLFGAYMGRRGSALAVELVPAAETGDA